MKRILVLTLLSGAAALAQAADTPYAGQQTRAIKALSADETRALLTGAAWATRGPPN